MKTKIYSLLLLLLGLLPESIFAQTTYNYTDTDGNVWTYTVDGSGNAHIINLNTSGANFTTDGSHIIFHGDELRIPSTVSNGTNIYTVTEIINPLLPSGFIAEKVVLPSSIKQVFGWTFFHTWVRRFVAEPGSQIDLGYMAFAINCHDYSDPMDADLYYDFSECPFNSSFSGVTAFGPTNDNALFFTNAASDQVFSEHRKPSIFAETDNVVRAGICASLHIDDEESFESPRTFTATQAKYERVFSNIAGKAVSTLYLPYPTDLPNGMRAYTLIRKGFDENGDKAFCFAPVPDGTRLEAYKPYLVQITDGASHTLPTMHNVTVPATPNIETSAIQASDDSDWKFYGTTLRIKNDKAYAKKAYYLNGNKWWAVQNGVTNDYIAPFRCFIISPTGAVPAKSFFMVLDEEDNNTTGIKSLENKTNEDIKSGKYPFYSVDGKLMGNDYNALEIGQIYIVNGKKFYKI